MKGWEVVGLRLLVLVLFMILVGRLAWWWCQSRIERMERLKEQGWVVVAWDFVLGPIMAPPPPARPPAPLLRRLQEDAFRQLGGAEAVHQRHMALEDALAARPPVGRFFGDVCTNPGCRGRLATSTTSDTVACYLCGQQEPRRRHGSA